MKDLLDRLSSYNFFNNLLPGVLFAILATKYTTVDLTSKDLFLGFFIYYFIGLVISRIGSLVIEPVLLKVKIIKYSDYSDYIKASKEDKKIDTLLEVNNTYRTIIAMFISLALFKGFDMLLAKYSIMVSLGPYILGFCLLILFLWSFRKQSNYINKRVETQNE